MKTCKNLTCARRAIPLALLIATGVAIADDNPANKATLNAAPAGAHLHNVLVKLNAKGEWGDVQSSNVKMRFAYTNQWSQKPNKDLSLSGRLYVGEAKIPKGGNNYYDPTQMSVLSAAQMLAPGGIWETELPFSKLVADGIPGTNIAGYCDMEKNNQLKKGRTLHQLLELGFTVNVNTSLRMYGTYSLGGGPNTSRPPSSHDFHLDGTAPIHIQCMGNPAIAAKVAPPSPSEGLGMDSLKTPFVVNSVDLSTLHMMTSKACPVNVTLQATIKGVGAGEVKYWLEEVGSNNGVQSLSTSLPGKAGEPNIRVLMQSVTLKPGPQDQAPPSPGIDALKLNTHGTPVKRSYRLHVIAPNKIQSEKLDVAVNCTSSPNAGLGGQGHLKTAPPAGPAPKEMPIAMPQPQPQPQPPKPMGLQAAPATQPKPDVALQAAPVQPVQPPKPQPVVLGVPVQAPKPPAKLMAVPVPPAKPASVSRYTQ